MEYSIRPFEEKDYTTVSSWWKAAIGQEVPVGMMVTNGTFILELNNSPSLCITVLLTQSKEMAYLFSYIKNPLFKNFNLESYGKLLWEHCFKWAKDNGYKRLICFADNNKLKEKYIRFGMVPTMEHLTSLKVEL